MTPPSLPKWSRQPFTTERPPSRRRVLFLVLLLLAVMTAAALQSPWRQRSSVPPAAPVEPQAPRYITLFFANAEGLGLASEIRPQPPCADEATCVSDAIRTLLDGPGPGLTPLLPLPTKVNGIEVHKNTVTIDLARDTINRLPGGSMSELLCLTGLIDTLAVNFPHIRQLTILIDGVPAQTLKGHVDLRQPFAADFALVRTTALTTTPSFETTINGREH